MSIIEITRPGKFQINYRLRRNAVDAGEPGYTRLKSDDPAEVDSAFRCDPEFADWIMRQWKQPAVSARARNMLAFLAGLLVMAVIAVMIAAAPKVRDQDHHAHLKQTDIGTGDFQMSLVEYEHHTYVIAHKTRESRVDVGIGMSMVHDPSCTHPRCR